MKPAKFKTPTCVLCRRRKLRCDGGEPCGPCSRTRTPVVCTYVPKTVGQLRSELPKGGACITCRQRKRRCDGNFPCRTCAQAGRPDDCKYRDKPPNAAKPRVPKLTSGREDHLSDTASSSSSSSRPTTPAELPFLTTGGLRLQSDYTEFCPTDSLFPWPELSSMCCSDDPVSTCALDNSIALPTLDCVPFPPLPGEGESEKIIVRDLMLQHRWHYGLNVTLEKHEAISNGDLSGLIVDPTLVNACELLGYILRYHAHPDGWLSFNSQSAAELELDLLVRDALEGHGSTGTGLGPAPLLTLQAYTLLCLYSAQKEDISGCQEFLVKGSNLVVHHSAVLGLEDAPALEWCPKFDASYLSPRNEAEEVRAAFSQLVYLDICAMLLLNFPSSIDPELVEKFRRLMIVHRSDTTTNFLRAKSFLFLLDSQQLVAAWNRWEFGDPAPSAWSKRYRTLIDDVHMHLNFMKNVILDVSYIPTLRDALVTLKICLIASLAALAELHGLFANTQPEARRQLRDAVGEIITITQGFTNSDYEFLDPPLSIPWSIAARTAAAAEWEGLGAPPDSNIPRFSQSAMFFNECNMKLRQSSPFTIQL